VARFARHVLDAAEAGDGVANAIVHEHGAALGDYALAAARRVGIVGASFTLALVGGVLRHPSALLREAIVARVRCEAPYVSMFAGAFEPAVGALLIALEQLGITADDIVLARLRASLPPETLFET
jgi:N-acetylglucosamine kinase-like BadF-type ATPase